MADSFTWPTPGLTITFQIAENRTVNIASFHPPTTSPPAPVLASAQLPIHQLRLLGLGNYDRAKTSKALVSSYLATRQRYVSHTPSTQGNTHHLTILTRDDEAHIDVSSRWTVHGAHPVVQCEVTVTNRSDAPITLTSLPSIVVGGLTSSTPAWWSAYEVHTATSSWFREAQWRAHSMQDTGVDVCLHPRLPASFHTFGVGNRGSFSTGSYLPIGIFGREGETWVWQVEAPGSWRWEVGDWGSEVYVALSGPTGNEHGWEEAVQPGSSFTSVAAALGRVEGGKDEAVQALTMYRRAMRRRHADNEAMFVIFNDYMNCLMGDPTAAKVGALIGPARDAGAEAFVIDAGWYADEEDWWDGIGEWEVSAQRFPDGLEKTLHAIADAGMTPGLWLEPECVGVKSAMVNKYPVEAFFTYRGHKVMERDRYVLDFRCKAVVEHMDATVAKLIAMGARYFKFDYNVEVIQGTDAQGESAGAGHLRHNRAYMAWVASLFDRYPGLVIENCSSGAQRMDYAMLALHPLQSTSDQEDPVRYAAVSAAIASAVAPEQGASWAYPQPGWSDELNAFTVVNSLLGRVHLSGRLDLLSNEQAKLVKDGMDVYKSIRQEIRTAVPFWPLGFPKWHDDWLAFGLKCESRSLVSVWRRGGGESCEIPIAHLGTQEKVQVKLLYPASFSAELAWDGKGAAVVKLPDAPCARMFSLE